MGGKKKKKSREERTGVGQGVNARPRTRGPGWPTSPGPESLAIHGFPKLWGRRPRRSPACRSTSGTRSTDPQLHRSQVTGLGRAGRTRVSSSPGHSGNRGSGLGAQVIVPPAPSVPGPPAPSVPVDLKHQAPGHRCAGRPRAPSAEPRGPQPPACRSVGLESHVAGSPGFAVCWSASGPRVLGSSGPRCAGRPRVLGSTACWSTSGPRVPGMLVDLERRASGSSSPGVPVGLESRVPGSPGPRVPRSPGPPVPSVLVGLASRVALSPGPRSPLCRSTSSPTSPSRHLPRACWSTSKRLDLGASGRPRQREGAAGRPSPPQERTGGAQGRPTRASRPPLPRPASPGKGRTGTHGPATPRPRASPSGKGGHAAAPPTPPARRRHGHDPTGSSFPVPARGPKAPARRRAGGSQAARKRADAPGGAPPLSPRGPNALPPPLKAAPRPSFPKGRDAHAFPPPAGRPTERARGHARARPANRSVARSGRGGPRATRRRSAGPRPARGDGEESGRTDGRTKAGASRTRAARPLFLTGVSDKPLCRGLTFNRSQRGSCSATYETPTQKQVVYEWFSTRFPTNVRCVTGEGAAPFPAAPRFPGRGALRTGPRSRRAAGHATPRGARAAARRRGRRGTGYPRPTEAPRRCRIVPPGRDSDLEAFSHNPTDGSFAPLAPQPSTYTKCLNLRFLSY